MADASLTTPYIPDTHRIKLRDTEDRYSLLCNNNIDDNAQGLQWSFEAKSHWLCYRRERHAIFLGIPIENVADGPKEAGEGGCVECGDLEFGLGRVRVYFGADGCTAGFGVQEGEFWMGKGER